jgi:hypothetical protein
MTPTLWLLLALLGLLFVRQLLYLFRLTRKLTRPPEADESEPSERE